MQVRYLELRISLIVQINVAALDHGPLIRTRDDWGQILEKIALFEFLWKI